MRGIDLPRIADAATREHESMDLSRWRKFRADVRKAVQPMERSHGMLCSAKNIKPFRELLKTAKDNAEHLRSYRKLKMRALTHAATLAADALLALPQPHSGA